MNRQKTWLPQDMYWRDDNIFCADLPAVEFRIQKILFLVYFSEALYVRLSVPGVCMLTVLLANLMSVSSLTTFWIVTGKRALGVFCVSLARTVSTRLFSEPRAALAELRRKHQACIPPGTESKASGNSGCKGEAGRTEASQGPPPGYTRVHTHTHDLYTCACRHTRTCVYVVCIYRENWF